MCVTARFLQVTEKVKRCITCWEFPLFVSFEAPDRNGAFPWCSAEAEYTAVIGAAPREQLFRSVRLNTKRFEIVMPPIWLILGLRTACSHNEWPSLQLRRASLRSRGATHVLPVRQLHWRRSEPGLSRHLAPCCSADPGPCAVPSALATCGARGWRGGTAPARPHGAAAARSGASRRVHLMSCSSSMCKLRARRLGRKPSPTKPTAAVAL